MGELGFSVIRYTDYKRGGIVLFEGRLISWGQHYPNTNAKDRFYKKGNLQVTISYNIGVKILSKRLAKRIQENIRRIIHPDQVGFIPGMQDWLNNQKPMYFTISTG